MPTPTTRVFIGELPLAGQQGGPKEAAGMGIPSPHGHVAAMLLPNCCHVCAASNPGLPRLAYTCAAGYFPRSTKRRDVEIELQRCAALLARSCLGV